MNKIIPNKTLLFGRIVRFSLVIFFIFKVWSVYRDVDFEGAIIREGWAIGLVVFYLMLHFFILKFTPKINKILGAKLAFDPF